MTLSMDMAVIGKDDIIIPLLTHLIDPNWINSELTIALVKNFK